MILFGQEFTLAQAAIELKPLAIYVIGMAVYSMIVFRFYRVIAKKDLIELNLQKYNKAGHPVLEKTLAVILYLVEYVFVFPVIAFISFLVLSGLLMVLSTEYGINEIFFIAMALIAAVRATSYYNEDLSRDLAKMLPFTLLGIFLVNKEYLASTRVLELAAQSLSAISTVAYYFVFIVLLEFALRILFGWRKTEDEE